MSTRHGVKHATHFKPLDLDSCAKQFKCDGQQSLSIEWQELKIRFLSFFFSIGSFYVND